LYGLSPVKSVNYEHEERLLTDGDEPRRARQLGAKLAPQPCIRLDPRGTRTMKQQMRFGGEAPRRRTHSRYGMQAMRLLGHRHLGST
jgi:hypothetical protein